MELTLKVIRFDNRPPDHPLSHRWEGQGGSLGRSAGNDWVLPDTQRFLSGRHAAIEYRDGEYFIRDTSTNGVFINQGKTPLGKNNVLALHNGDRIRIGIYELEVVLSQARQADEPAAAVIAPDWNAGGDWEKDPFDFLQPGAAGGASKAAERPPPILSNAADGAFYMPDIVMPEPAGNKATFPTGDASILPPNWWETPAVPPIPAAPPAPPPVADSKPAAQTATDDFDQLFADIALAAHPVEEIPPQPEEKIPAPAAQPARDAPSPPKPRPPPVSVPVSAPQPTAGNSDALDLFLQGMGIQDAGKRAAIQQAQDLQTLGRLFHIAIQGTLDALQARAEIKSALRMDVTTIQRGGNNPLKFSVTADDAIDRLLSPRNAAYLPPEQALLEAFDDIRAHQLAVIAGVQAALTQVLKRFDPALLVQRLEKNNPFSANIPIQRQAKLWELFEDLYTTLEQECQDDFQRLFGLEFARAYDAQVAKLKGERGYG